MTDDLHALIRERLERGAAAAQRLLDPSCLEATAAAARMLVDAYRGGGKTLLFGNGGSAAEAQHLAAELVGRFLIDRPALPALALTTNTSSLSAIANDMSYEDVFTRQVEAFGRPGDVALGLSTSGASENVARALSRARDLGLKSIALTGSAPSRVGDAADLCLRMPSDETQHVQEGHLAIGHLLCEIVERELGGAP